VNFDNPAEGKVAGQCTLRNSTGIAPALAPAEAACDSTGSGGAVVIHSRREILAF